jgi:DNA-binding NarL/FixJ family response regulator
MVHSPQIHLIIADGKLRILLELLVDSNNVISPFPNQKYGKSILEVQLAPEDIIWLYISSESPDLEKLLIYFQKISFENKIIIGMEYYNAELIDRCFRLGARAFLSKTTNSQNLKRAIKIVASGKVYKENVEELLEHIPFKSKNYFEHLFSMAEKRLLPHLCSGKSFPQIASELSLSPKTIENEARVIYKKTKVKNRIELAIFMVKQNLR